MDSITFENVIAYRISEIGAMGPAGTMTCLKSNGEHFEVNYLSEKTPWEEIKKCFPGINGNRFNGPIKKELPFSNVIVFGGNDNYGSVINEGWSHMWLDYGNHLVCKEEYFSELKKALKGKDNCDITFDWVEILKKGGFVERIPQIEADYLKQKARDEEITSKLTELNNSSEYKKKMEIAGSKDGVNGMLKLLKDEYGLDIDFMELKQYSLRMRGLD